MTFDVSQYNGFKVDINAECIMCEAWFEIQASFDCESWFGMELLGPDDSADGGANLCRLNIGGADKMFFTYIFKNFICRYIRLKYFGFKLSMISVGEDPGAKPSDGTDICSCVWKQDNDGNRSVECRNSHTFFDGGPKENRYVFCPYCGRRLQSRLINNCN